MSDASGHHRSRRRTDLRDALEPIAEAPAMTSSAHLEAVGKAILAPFHRKKGDSSKMLADLAPVLMTPRMMNAAAASTSKPRSSLGPSGGHMDLAKLGRAPMRFSLGTRRITSADLQIVEAADELLQADIPEPDGVASDVSLLRGFNATIPSAEKGKARRRQTRNVETPRMGLKKLSMSARGMLTNEEREHESASEDDVVVVGKSRLKGKRRGRPRESLGANVKLGKEELWRQEKEIVLDKENLHVRRALVNNEIEEITHKIDALHAIRENLESDLLKLQEEELELADELEGVRERMEFEDTLSSSSNKTKHIDHSSSRRKHGPLFLPSEHAELPPGVAFLTLSHSLTNQSLTNAILSPITALDFSEPYGTLVSADADPESAPRVWDLMTCEEIGRLEGHRGAVKALQVEEHVCLTGGEDGCVRLWDLRRVGGEVGVESEAEVDAELVSLGDISEEAEAEDNERTPAPKRPIRPNGIRQSPHENDPGSSGACARVLEGHSKAVSALFFEENCLVTGAADKTLRQWDLATGQCVMTMDILWAITHAPASMSASASSLSSSYSSYSYGGLGGGASTAAYVPGTATAALGTFAFPAPPRADGSWDMYTDFVGAVQFWGYGLVSGSGDGAVRMWDMRTGQAHRTLLGHTAPVTCLQFDQLHVVSGGLDKTIRIWDIRTGGIFETIKFDYGVTALQFDSRKIVAAAGENGVKIYNRTTMQFSTLSTNGHTKPVERLRYMDKYLVSGGRDAQLKIWAL